ncbi:hypothetical protein H4R23_003462 [Coemansia sp. Cherry 401B]|nr:hypothetical protein H4R23_003462 [Coemansia sp. Cherry 401B]
MSASEFLNTLRDFNLEHLYPSLQACGIISNEGLVQYGISEDNVSDLKTLILTLRDHYGISDPAPYQEYPSKMQMTMSYSGDVRGRNGMSGFGDSDEEQYPRRDNGHGQGGGIPRPGGKGRSQGRRPSSIYGIPSAPSNGIPRATPASSFSPPMQPMRHNAAIPQKDQRTIGRQGLPPPGNPGASRIGRRQTLAPTSQGFGHSRVNDSGPKTMAVRHGGGRGLGPSRPSLSNMSDILERTNAFTQSQQIGEDSDDELERVVRKPGQSSLVNAYGIPVRPKTGHVKRSASERRSLAPGATGLRPKTAHRSVRDESGLGLAPIKEIPSNLNDKIRVCVRKRPLNGKEREKGEKDVVVSNSNRSLSVMEPKVKVDLTKYIEESRFKFDEVFSEQANNAEVYERTAKPLVDYIFSGGNATCFAYGQTGSGKTYTMMDTHNGLYIQAAEDIFALLARPENQHLQAFLVFYEIYLTNLFDLLNDRKKLFAREDANQNVCIQGVREVLIQSPADLLSVFEYGNSCRSTGSTGANSDSSRSHAIMQIAIKDTTKRRPVQIGKLSFIDLAGNERGSDRGDKANKQTMMEGAEINKGLLALKECIRSLDLKQKHQPFRQSKLTQVLKDSFIGNSRACMIANISPNTANCDNTLNTLRYAERVKAMKSGGGSGGEGTAAANGSPREAEGYFSNEYDDPTYEDDSRERALEDAGDAGYNWSDAQLHDYGQTSFQSASHDVYQEEDEYVNPDPIEDEFASVSTSYHRHRQQQQQQQPQKHRRQISFEEPLDRIAEEAPSLMDEQPAFLDEIKAPLRSPRVYGSPAAKNFVSSRLVKSPTARKLRAPSQLTGLRGGMSAAYDHSEEPEGTRLPMLGRSNSVSFDAALSGEQPLSPVGKAPRFGVPTPGARSRGNTHSGGSTSERQRQQEEEESAVPYSTGTSDPSDSNSPEEQGDTRRLDTGDDVFSPDAPADDINTLVAPFGGLRIGDVDSLVKQHRAEIRATTEACKEETMLISAYTAFSYAQLVQQSKNKSRGEGGHARPSSWQQQAQGLADKYHLDMNTGAVTRLADGERFDSVEKAKMSEAIEYLEKLDEVLARKQQLIVDLREGIRKLVWGEGITG